ncbi:MAG: acetyl-CoA hydrolase/transferase C-terminal domain-containing protein [Rhizobiaceae bacterium]
MTKINHLSEIAAQFCGGKHVVFHASVSESAIVGRQLIDRCDLWPGLSVETFMPGSPCPYLEDDRISVATVMPGGHLRQAVNDGMVTVLRESLFQQAQAYATNRRRADVLVLQVSPANEDGMVSLGPSVGIVPQVLAQQPFVVGVINRHVPQSNFTIPAARLDAIIEFDRPLPEVIPSASDTIDQQIADNVLTCLSNGITIEVGMGGTPDAVMRALPRLDDIHIHTGLINDAIMDVVSSGGLRAPVTTTMAVGSTGFYNWLDGNTDIDFQPISETHDPDKLGQLPRFHTINAALQLDLAGNVNAERIGDRIISCPGGLPDFAAGARRSAGGCNIIVLRSTAGRDGKSTIVPTVNFQTLDGSLVDIIVTEHGIADLRGLNASRRAAAIRSVAHPHSEIAYT